MNFLLAILAILLAIWFYRKTLPELTKKQKIWLIVLRSISWLILIILLLNPILRFEKEELIKPLAIILKDNSTSMHLPAADKTKSEIFQTYLSKTRDLLDNQYQIVEYNFAADLAGDSATSLISPSLQTLLQKHKPAEIGEIFLFSDGWFQDDNLQTLQRLNLPINCLVPDISQDISDLMIASIEKNETAFIDDISPLQVNLQAKNYRGIAKLEIFYEGKSKSQEIDFAETDFQSISFDLNFESSGLKKISAELIAADLTEKNLENNQIATAIKVEKQRKKILIISDKLNWDIRFLQNALQADNKFGTVLLNKTSTLRKAQQEANLAQEIKSVDLLILSNFGDLIFSSLEQNLINNYHANGGSILFWGEHQAQLSEILPSKATSIRSEFSATFSLTPTAAKYATFDFEPANIPPLSYKYLRPKAEAEILATFDNYERSPFILFSQLNAKVIHLAGQDLWRWQMQSDDLRYNKFILDLANWLSTKSKDNF